MGYIYIALSVFFNAAKGFSSKKVSASLATQKENVIFNTKRMLLSFLFALAVALFGCSLKDLIPSKTELLICAVAGMSMTVFALLWQTAIRSSAYMLASAGSSGSFIVPVVCGLLFWNERFTLSSGISICLIVASLFFLLKYDSALKGKICKKDLIVLFFLLLSQGIMLCMQKAFVLYAPQKSISVYNFYYFLSAVLFSLVLLLFFKKGNQVKEKVISNFKQTAYMVVMSGSLFAVSFFQTMAAKTVDAIILYPLISGLGLVGGALMAALCFKEKPNRNCIIGIVLVLGAVVVSKISF